MFFFSKKCVGVNQKKLLTLHEGAMHRHSPRRGFLVALFFANLLLS